MQKAFEIEYRGISKSFGPTKVLSEINLTVKPGEFAVFVGPSGSGKSTLLRILAGLENCDRGEILIGGRNVTDLPPKDRDVAMVFQNYALYPHMSVEENITFGMKLRKEPKHARDNALSRVVSMLQLEGLLGRKPGQLSGGQRQRVAMARAIVRNPKAFLMDEPLSNLDAKLRNEVRAAIIEQQRKLGVSTIYVTHDQIEAMTMAHRIVVLRQGLVQQVGTPEELYLTPSNSFVAEFIGSPIMNFMPVGFDGSAIFFPGGASLPLPESHPLRLGAGLPMPDAGNATPILGGIRPEHMRLEGEAANRANDRVYIRSQVTGREMLGAEYIVKVRDTTAFFQVRVPSSAAVPQIGENTTVSFTVKDLHCFDPATQLRIA